MAILDVGKLWVSVNDLFLVCTNLMVLDVPVCDFLKFPIAKDTLLFYKCVSNDRLIIKSMFQHPKL